VKPEEAASFWKLAYRTWTLVHESEPFWEQVETRIAEIGDPRLKRTAARRIRQTLPLALLSINARLAVQAAERGDAAASNGHRTVMTQSGFQPETLERALRMAVDPLRSRIATLDKEAESDYLEDGEKGLEIAVRLLKQAAPLLSAIDGLFPAGDPVREDVHDTIAGRARTAVIKYGNTKDLDDDVLKMLKRILLVAEGASARQNLETDMETVKRLMKEAEENAVYLKCWFCNTRVPVVASSATVPMYGNVRREFSRVKWQQNNFKVPRCGQCQIAHTKVSSRGTVSGSIGVSLVIGALLWYLATTPDAKNNIGGLGCGGLIACVVVGKIFASIGSAIGKSDSLGGVKPESEKYSFPSIVEARRQGWELGTQPPGVQ